MKIPCIIEQTLTAATYVLNTVRPNRPGLLMLVGTMDSDKSIEIQRPAVFDPDKDNDAHWITWRQSDPIQNIAYDVKLTADNVSWAVPVGAIIRIKKPATTNAVGVSWT